MHHSGQVLHLNKIKNRNDLASTSYNKCVEIMPSQVLQHSGEKQTNRKYVNKINATHLAPYKRAVNFPANNMHNKNAHTALKMSNSYRDYTTNKYQNVAGAYAENKYNTTFNRKKFISPKTHLQNIENHESVNKVILETTNFSSEKCEKIPNLQPNVEQNQQKLLNDSLGSYHEADQNTDEGPTLCNAPSSDDEINNENITQIEDNQKEEKLDKTAEDENGCISESLGKTPMCLVNDLARFNKIPFQYRLTSEHGPAHCKRFTVTLKLGDEEYTAEGCKIKKAQHLAAKEAIEKTKYEHPISKTNRRNDNEVTKINITPTVELNALAMKLGQQTYYIFDSIQTLSSENNVNSKMPRLISNYNTNPNRQSLDKCQNCYSKLPQTYYILDPNQMRPSDNNINSKTSQMPQLISNYNANQNRRSFDKCQNCYSRLPQSVHKNKFNQLITVKPLYVSNSAPYKVTLIVGNKKFFGIGKSPQQAKHDAAAKALHVLKNQMNSFKTETQTESSNESGHKSPISLVFEIGIKRNLHVDFKVLREEGPAHMRTFTTACIVGDILTEGEGTGKKLSKKRAAQKMIEELKKLPPLSPDTSPIKRTKIKTFSKKVEVLPTNSVADCKRNKRKIIADTDSSNPVKKVMEWHQNNNEKAPVFKIVNESEKKNSRKRQYVMEISSNKINARGTGNTVKLAKRDAAQNFLNAVCADNEVHLSKTDDISGMQSECPTDETMEQENDSQTSDEKIINNEKESCVELKSENSSDLEAATKSFKSLKLNDTTSKKPVLLMKDQLLYLANLLGFEVDFSDYPKGNHNEFLTIVMLSTNPPLISHGVGINSEESQENASQNALKILSEMGLNNAVKS